MSDLRIVTVTSPAEQRHWLELPWKIYAGDPHWVPPLRQNQRDLAGFGQHPFYQSASAQAFLAVRDGEPCGRVLAIENRAHNEWHREQRGFFGFFESIDDQQVANALLGTAAEWLRGRGMTSMRGPANPSINYEWGLLVDGFDGPPMFMMTYNPEYYGRRCEEFGLAKVQDMYAYRGHVDMLPTMSNKHRLVDEGIRERFGVKLRPMSRWNFRRDVATFLDIYNRALSATWGFVPLTKAEVDRLAAELRQLIVPSLTQVAMVGDKPIGVVFGLLDYNQRIREIDGRLFPFGWLKLLTNRRGIKRMRIVSANVLPEYQNWGVGIVLARGLIEPVLAHGIEEAEFSWVLESNDLSRKTLEKGGALRYRTYRIYDYPLLDTVAPPTGSLPGSGAA